MDPQQVRVMKVVLLVSSLLSLLVLSATAYRENFAGEWRALQREYRDLLVETAPDKTARLAAQAMPIEPRQLFLEELEAIDRCTTCHQGVENPSMADAPAPHRRHPGKLLANHPPEKFGCTICHQGQGRAMERDKAHGWRADGSPVPHMEAPLLRGEAVYTSCGRCHHETDLYGGYADLYAGDGGAGSPLHQQPIQQAALEQTLPGADMIAEGRRLVIESGCLGCHKYRGRGGVLGPDLTYVGDKSKHDFDFTKVKGEHTVEQWLFEHFMTPAEISPGTIMPEMGLLPEQGRQLAQYMMSLHRKDAPASHIPPPVIGTGASSPVRGETLYRMYCSACHGPDGLGTTMRAGLWPQDADPWGHQWDARNVVAERRSNIEVMVPSLNHPDTLATVSDDYLRYIITHGRPGTNMIGWQDEGGLSNDEITLLVDYIRGWQRPAAGARSVATLSGDARIGGALYRANCASCHGSNGEGGIGVSLNSPTFLAVASDAYLRDTILHGRANTAMPAWRQFDAQEVSDLLAFLREWQPTRADREKALVLCDGPDTPAVSAAIGATLYKANCVMCHGKDGGGDLAPTLNTQAFLTVVSDAFLVDTLLDGRPNTGMPSWRHFSSEDIACLVRFIRTWQKADPRSDAWHARTIPRGDWDAGRILYVGHCAGCHGSEAQGAIGPQLNNRNFLRITSDVMLAEWIANGKEGTEMRGFRKGAQGITELTDRQIEDIVAYLRSLERKGEGEILRVAKSPHGRPEKGAAIYVANCAGCHGDRGQGASGPALSNPDFLAIASDGYLMATMALGRSGTEMRPVKRSPQSILGLSSDEVNDVLAYVRSWEHDPPFAPGGPDAIPHRFVVPWDLAEGRSLFQSNCAGCHGEEGRGLWAPEINNEGFLAAVTDGVLQATIVRGRKGTAMRPFGAGSHGLVDLSGEDIDNIVSYIRQWSTRAPSPMTIPARRSTILTETSTQPKDPAARAKRPAEGHTRAQEYSTPNSIAAVQAPGKENTR